MLQTVITQNQVTIAVFQQGARRRDTVRPNRHGTSCFATQQHRLVTHHDRVTVRPDLLWPVRGHAAIASSHKTRPVTGLNEVFRQPGDQRCLAGATNCQIANHDDRYRQPVRFQ